METENTVVTLPEVLIPNNIKELWALKQIKSSSVIIAGGTLIQVQWETGESVPSSLISIESIKDLTGISVINNEEGKFIKIGTLTRLAECITDMTLLIHAPILAEACKNIAAPAVRNRGTVGGNICSGLGDAIPVLLCLDSLVEYYDGNGYTTTSLNAWLSNKLQAKGCILTAILIPIQEKILNNTYFYEKVGRREAFNVALISLSIICYKDSKSKANEIRICIGGGNHNPQRLEKTENFLKNTDFEKDLNLAILYELIYNEIDSYTDAFSTANYRKLVGTNLILSYITEQFCSKGRVI
ncbi:FAD binding domain-containing protein [Litchfieldia alkalitelluris]|uniref:FAD binding domain-containing protein n=1 Tax=Litchfieldia alkalitelluris TaxID=304268 RepID=UPI000997E3C8|nr:FAD binding domain-containing protein [Litchfieldia alkalitelluris]